MARVSLIADASALAREHTVEAIDKIATLINSMDPRVALEAAKTMLDRAHGKPLSAVIVVPGNRKNQATLSAMTDAQLMEELEAGEDPLPTLPPPGKFLAISQEVSVDSLTENLLSEWDDPLLSAISQDGSRMLFDERGNPMVVQMPAQHDKLQSAQPNKLPMGTRLPIDDDPLLQ